MRKPTLGLSIVQVWVFFMFSFVKTQVSNTQAYIISYTLNNKPLAYKPFFGSHFISYPMIFAISKTSLYLIVPRASLFVIF